MKSKAAFQEKLSGILEIAKAQQNVVSTEEVEQYFEDDSLSKAQIDLVYDYLLSQKVAVTGYEKQGGTVKEETTFTAEEEAYLADYLKDLELIEKEVGVEQGRLYRAVVEIAKELYSPQVFLGDMIQEGNVYLMAAMGEAEEEAFRRIRQGMQMLIEEQTDARQRDNKMVEKVNRLDEAITKLTEDLGRKVTLEELAIYMEMTEEDVIDIMKLAGEDLEHQEEEQE